MAAVTEIIIRLRLFWGAYVPLFFLLALRFHPRWLVVSCLLLGIGGLLSLSLLFRAAERVAADYAEIEGVRDEGAAVAAFLATYLLPFLTVSAPSVRDVIAYSLFLGLTAVITVRSQTAQINPTLYLVGYRAVSIRTTGGWTGWAIVLRSVKPGDRIRKVNLSDEVLVQVPRASAQSSR